MTTDIIKLNVRGVHYSIARSTIIKFRNSMLGRMVAGNWQESIEQPIYIDRDGERFQYILEGYREG